MTASDSPPASSNQSRFLAATNGNRLLAHPLRKGIHRAEWPHLAESTGSLENQTQKNKHRQLRIQPTCCPFGKSLRRTGRGLRAPDPAAWEGERVCVEGGRLCRRPSSGSKKGTFFPDVPPASWVQIPTSVYSGTGRHCFRKLPWTIQPTFMTI